MMTNSATQSDRSVSKKAEKFLRLLTKALAVSGVEIRLWNGTHWCTSGEGIPKVTLIFHDPYSVRQMFIDPDSLTLGEAYINGAFDVEGNMKEVFALADSLTYFNPSLYQKSQVIHYLRAIPQRPLSQKEGWNSATLSDVQESREQVRQAINFHYNLPIEFWRLWLDQSLTYSCAYFRSPESSLDTAQEDKLDYICRKLDLRPGETFLDMGCGWGSLTIHAAKHYGAQALGVTLSSKQADFASAKIHEFGLQNNASVKLCDVRDIKGECLFNKISSVGMLEHVPQSELQEYFSLSHRLLKPNGVFFSQGITRNPTLPMRPGKEFLATYVFPGHYLGTIGEILNAGEQVGMEVRDVENLREHYVATLNHWHHRLESQRSSIELLTNPKTFRVFQLYLAGTAYEMYKGRVHVYQSLFIKPGGNISGSPQTRKPWYVDSMDE